MQRHSKQYGDLWEKMTVERIVVWKQKRTYLKREEETVVHG